MGVLGIILIGVAFALIGVFFRTILGAVRLLLQLLVELVVLLGRGILAAATGLAQLISRRT